MDEINAQVTPAETADLNDIDVSDIDFGADEADEAKEAETAEKATPETDDADPQKQPEGEPKKEEAKTEDAEKQTDQFTLKHLDEVKTVSKDEVIALAQKGMDYDRLKAKSEERFTALDAEHKQTLEALDVFAQIAKRNNYKDAAELADNTLAQMMVNDGDYATVDSALKQIRLDRREKKVAEKEQKLTAITDSKTKVDADAKAFIDKYPNIDFKAIPAEVWATVDKGESLVTAYGDYIADKARKDLAAENERLKAELEATKKNAENKSRSTGSVTSAGKDSIKDPWLADLETRF